MTGSTDGIGKAFAHELASRGFNVVVHGRNPSKMAATEAELRSAYPERDFRTLMADASRVPCLNCLEVRDKEDDDRHEDDSSTAVDFASLASFLSDIHLTVLISNVGGGGKPAFLTRENRTPKAITSTVSTDALFPLHLLSHLIPSLCRNSPSLIINVGSLSDNGFPLQSVYAPAKVFVVSLAGCVAREMRFEGRSDVEVMATRVGRVTGVSDYKEKPTLFEPDTGTFVRAALARVGCGRAEVVPYWGHALQQVLALQLMPGWLRERIFQGVIRDLRDKEREQEREKIARERKYE